MWKGILYWCGWKSVLEVNNLPSEKILEQKKQQVAELCEAFKAANVGVLVDYTGISVDKDTTTDRPRITQKEER